MWIELTIRSEELVTVRSMAVERELLPLLEQILAETDPP
jgi:hypothetical protein